jgi:hypothetical protein
MTSLLDLDYVHEQTPEWILSITSEIRVIQSTLTTVLDQNKIPDQRVNSFSETELLLQQTRQELVTAQQEIKSLKEQLVNAKKAASTPLTEFPVDNNEPLFNTDNFPEMSASLPPLKLGSSQSQWAKGSPILKNNKLSSQSQKKKKLTPRKIANYVRTFGSGTR